MPATKGEKAGVFIISFLMILSVIGGSLLYIFEQNQQEKRVEENAKLQEELELQQQFSIACSSMAASFAKQDIKAPKIEPVKDEINDLEKIDIKEGTDKEVVDGDCAIINYHGVIAATGEMFDSSYVARLDPEGEALDLSPFNAIISPTAGLIEGWKQGIPGLKVGGVRQLNIPADLAYGDFGSRVPEGYEEGDEIGKGDDGRLDFIPPKTSLIFQVELLDVLKFEGWEPEDISNEEDET